MNFKRLLICVIISTLTIACTKTHESKQVLLKNGEKKSITASDLAVDKNGQSKSTVLIKTVHGNISFKFYPKMAPNTVTRMIQLVQQGFYDGLTFHRVIPNFVVQTGDPQATGAGGTGTKIKAEFNSLQHIKGTLAMARHSNDIDSADSQFYIALTTLPHLDNKYTIFGQVIDGLELLKKIQKGDKILSMSLNLN